MLPYKTTCVGNLCVLTKTFIEVSTGSFISLGDGVTFRCDIRGSELVTGYRAAGVPFVVSVRWKSPAGVAAATAPLDEEAKYLEGFDWLTGLDATDPETTTKILDNLKEKGFLLHVEEYPHVYPHCWRSGEELVFRIVDEWYINMDWRDRIKKIVDDIEQRK